MKRFVTVPIAALLLTGLGAGTPAAAAEPDPNRHRWVNFSCSWDGQSPNAEAVVNASTWFGTRDIKDSNTSRVPEFVNLKTTIKIRKYIGSGRWSERDNASTETGWKQRRGSWIVPNYASPPYAVQPGYSRGSMAHNFGDTTLNLSPGDVIYAEVKVTLDKRPGGKKWSYSKATKAIECPMSPDTVRTKVKLKKKYRGTTKFREPWPFTPALETLPTEPPTEPAAEPPATVIVTPPLSGPSLS